MNHRPFRMAIVQPSPRGIVGTVSGKPGLYRAFAEQSTPGRGHVCLYVHPVDEPGSIWPIHRDNFTPVDPDHA